MSNSKTRDLALKYLSFMESGDVPAALELTSNDATFWFPASGNLSKTQYADFFSHISPLVISTKFNIDGITEESDRIAIEVTGSAELTNGKTYNNQYHFLFIVRNGLIHQIREYADTAPAVVFMSK
ncbi:nuclear transport factor 2 family protein [Pseudomonas sp. FP2300]|uniref:nuclear transport factor 2 family protein n=1 Tax=Pseudomonas sp. FP2300 TaxID=2954090 RepID=UPI0027347D59|nr:nuclear transport factor 2 family protein [Pseudomonas sp. FP2300]WLH65168.1 nuclear transport factor 2 family protein [Pseudomonas sp. FP2300]